jgi:hypothetical protein
MANDEYGDNVWEPQLPEVWDGIHGLRLIREEGRPLTTALRPNASSPDSVNLR